MTRLPLPATLLDNCISDTVIVAAMDTTISEDFLTRLKHAGITPGDDDRERLNKTLLVFATGLISVTSAIWLMIYGVLGSSLSSTLPFIYQLLLTGNLVNYIRTGNFPRFRSSQLALFLLAPFIMQWAIGDFINSSGVILWGLLGPFGAMVCLGTRESVGWFLAWVGLTLLSGLGDLLPFTSRARHSHAHQHRLLRAEFHCRRLNHLHPAALLHPGKRKSQRTSGRSTRGSGT